MFCIFNNKRRKFQNDEYVLAAMFFYIDIFLIIYDVTKKLKISHTNRDYKQFMTYIDDYDENNNIYLRLIKKNKIEMELKQSIKSRINNDKNYDIKF